MAEHYNDTDKKLKKLEDAVNAEVEKKIENMLSEADKTRSDFLNSAADEALQLAYDRIKAQVKQISAKYNKIAAKAEFDGKKEVLLHREELIKNLFNTVENKLSMFRKSAEYKDFMIKQLKGEKIKKDAVILLGSEDVGMSEELKNNLPESCVIKEDSTIRFGGLSIMYEKDNVIIDKTIDSALKDERALFNNKNCFILK